MFLVQRVQSTTVSELETVRVKRKGQVAIPIDVRRRYAIKEGDLLSIETTDDRTIVMRIKKPLEPGRPVAPEEQKRIVRDLEQLRGSWQ